MKIHKLSKNFEQEITFLEQTLRKSRGYGVVTIQIDEQLEFGIPLRSNLPNEKGCFVVSLGSNGNKKGLDYSKAILIKRKEDVSNEIFQIPSEEKDKIQNYQHKIKKDFSKYVKRYIDAVKNEKKSLLNSREYRFTTLVNYHEELKLD